MDEQKNIDRTEAPEELNPAGQTENSPSKGWQPGMNRPAAPKPLQGWQPPAGDPPTQSGEGTPPPQRPVSPYSAEAWEKGESQTRVPAAKPPKKPFIAGKWDGIFALVFFVVSYLLLRWDVLWQGSGLRMIVFTLLYAGTVLGYARGKNIPIRRESWFWFAMMLGCALGCSLWGPLDNGGYWAVQIAFLLGMAVYWPMSLSGALFSGRADNWMPLDFIRGFFILPFGNFGCGFSAIGQNAVKLRRGRTLLGILLGVLISIPILGIVLPQLMSADVGFQNLIERFFDNILHYLATFLLYGIFAVPTSCYLYGLAAGCFHKRGLDKSPKDFEKSVGSLRLLPMATLYTALGIVCFVYLLFIGVQAGYLFSAFRGACPEGYSSYAEYARKGFFELCRVAAFNGAVLLAANVFSRSSCREAAALKGFNIGLSLLTILLLTTAFSKMALYVSAYGLSVRRFLPCWFMAFLTVCFLMVIVLQFRSFSIVRGVAVTGAAMFVALCLINVNGVVAGYNLSRYQKGTLPDFDLSDVYDYDLSGVGPALKIYRSTQDGEDKAELGWYLHRMYVSAEYENQSWLDMTAQSIYAEKVLGSLKDELQSFRPF